MIIDFYLTQQGSGKEECLSLLSFLESIGHQVDGHDINGVAEDQTCRRETELVITYAIGGQQGVLKDRALSAGKPVLVLELGYLGSRYKHIGMSLLVGKDDRLHNNNGRFLKNAQMPDDRLRSLGVEIETQDKAPVGKALLLGQLPGDSQLGGVNIITWARDVMSMMNQAGYEVTFRPHPGLIPSEKTLTEEMVAHNLVAGFNSTALVEAIRLGVPFCCDGFCQYVGMGTTNMMRPVAHSAAERRQFLSNLAYCQFTTEDFGNGTAWAHARELMDMRGVRHGENT
jgi:hypothetical protein